MFGAVELKKEGVQKKKHPWIEFLLAKPLQALTLYRIKAAGGHCLATDNAKEVEALLDRMKALKCGDKGEG